MDSVLDPSHGMLVLADIEVLVFVKMLIQIEPMNLLLLKHMVDKLKYQ